MPEERSGNTPLLNFHLNETDPVNPTFFKEKEQGIPRCLAPRLLFEVPRKIVGNDAEHVILSDRRGRRIPLWALK
ncbi:hypothetical protein D6833_08405 [Candidatus Parcubacteria bacterium]|nr:MAG: hypothetical protein D6833_08405 [Candidatus Parcubacteria bacterium]